VPFLIDSNVLIDVSRGNAAAIKYVDSLPEPWSISQVTAMELIVGARDKRELIKAIKDRLKAAEAHTAKAG